MIPTQRTICLSACVIVFKANVALSMTSMLGTAISPLVRAIMKSAMFFPLFSLRALARLRPWIIFLSERRRIILVSVLALLSKSFGSFISLRPEVRATKNF